jgi:mRNA interferase MazF
MKQYVPQKGDFISVTFDSQSGHEQKGRRPALVVSNHLFNQKTGLAIVCPLTTADRNFPFHVAVIGNPDVRGFVMAEQVKSIDYGSRRAKYISKASDELIADVLAILDVSIY